jgi:hypothetical protein
MREAPMLKRLEHPLRETHQEAVIRSLLQLVKQDAGLHPTYVKAIDDVDQGNTVVAESTETRSAQQIRDAGCRNLLQGFLLSSRVLLDHLIALPERRITHV